MDRFVVCINDKDFWRKPYPHKGEICEVEKWGYHEGAIFLKLKGYDYLIDGYRVAFHSDCFRPVQNIDPWIEWIECTVLKESEYEHAVKTLINEKL